MGAQESHKDLHIQAVVVTYGVSDICIDEAGMLWFNLIMGPVTLWHYLAWWEGRCSSTWLRNQWSFDIIWIDEDHCSSTWLRDQWPCDIIWIDENHCSSKWLWDQWGCDIIWINENHCSSTWLRVLRVIKLLILIWFRLN